MKEPQELVQIRSEFVSRQAQVLGDQAKDFGQRMPEVIGVSGSNLIERMRERRKKRTCRPPLPDDKLVRQLQHRVLCCMPAVCSAAQASGRRAYSSRAAASAPRRRRHLQFQPTPPGRVGRRCQAHNNSWPGRPREMPDDVRGIVAAQYSWST
jgi:hypothetical protein